MHSNGPSTAVTSRGGEIDLNGDLVGQVFRHQPERVQRLRAAIGNDVAADVDPVDHLAAVLRMIPGAERGAAWAPR